MTFLMCGWPVVRAESLDGNALSSCSTDKVFARSTTRTLPSFSNLLSAITAWTAALNLRRILYLRRFAQKWGRWTWRTRASAAIQERHAQHGGPCAHDQCCPGDEPVTPATAFRRCVQKVIVANRRRSADKLLDVLCRDDIMTCSQLENVLENLEKIHPEFHHFEDLVKALDECANRETILHIEISPLVKDHREFLNEQPRVTASGSRHVHFALEPPEIMDV